MFGLKKVQTLNKLEMLAYHCVLEHPHQIPQQAIRRLAASCHTSALTILRFCNKMGYAGFSGLKYAVREETRQAQTFKNFYDATVHVDAFSRKLSQETYYEMLRPTTQMIVQIRHVAFAGIDTSEILGSYGSRYLANLNINSHSIASPFTSIPKRGLENTLALTLPVSEGTNEMIKQMTDFKTTGAKVLNITNNQHPTIARLADHSASYYMPGERSPLTDESVNTTTRIPVIALIGLLVHQADQLLKELDETPF